MPIYAYLTIPANSSDFGFLRSSVANEAILAVIIACVIQMSTVIIEVHDVGPQKINAKY